MNPGTSLELRPEQPVDRPHSQVDALIAEIMPAIRGGTHPDVVERQIALLERLMSAKNKEKFDAAMERAKRDLPPVLKLRRVEGLYDYAPLDSVIEQVEQVLKREGFTWDFDTDPAPPGYMTGVCIAKNFGHSERRAVTLPISTGNRASNATKDANGALTSAKRTAFKNVFGIVERGEDLDKGGRDAPAPAWASASKSGQSEPSAAQKPPPAPAAPSDGPLKAARARLSNALKLAGPDETPENRRAWMISEKIITADQRSNNMTIDQLHAAADKVEAWLETNT